MKLKKTLVVNALHLENINSSIIKYTGKLSILILTIWHSNISLVSFIRKKTNCKQVQENHKRCTAEMCSDSCYSDVFVLNTNLFRTITVCGS